MARILEIINLVAGDTCDECGEIAERGVLDKTVDKQWFLYPRCSRCMGKLCVKLISVHFHH